MTAGRAPVSVAQPVAHGPRRRIGVLRQERRHARRPPTFERSTPAFAHTNPCRVRLMIRPPSAMRSTSALSRSTSSTWRGSFPQRSAHCARRLARLDRCQLDHPALGLADDLLGHDQHVRHRQADAGGARPPPRSCAARSSPGCTSPHAVQGDELDAAPITPRRPSSSQRARSAGVSRSKARPARSTMVDRRRPARSTAARWAAKLPGPNAEVDRVRRAQRQPVRAATGAIGGNRHARRARGGGEERRRRPRRRGPAGRRGGRDQRRRRRRAPRSGPARRPVFKPHPALDGEGGARRRHDAARARVGRDDDHLVAGGHGGGQDVAQEPLGESRPLGGLQDGGEARLRMLEPAMRDDDPGRHPRSIARGGVEQGAGQRRPGRRRSASRSAGRRARKPRRVDRVGQRGIRLVEHQSWTSPAYRRATPSALDLVAERAQHPVGGPLERLAGHDGADPHPSVPGAASQRLAHARHGQDRARC